MYQSCWSDMSQPLSYLSIKYYSITLYSSVYHTQTFPSITLLDVGNCKAFYFSKPRSLIPYREVRKHMTAGLLTSTKSLCCSWSFVVLSSPSAATELRNLCSNSARNHDNFTALCQQCTDEAGSGPLLGSWVSEMSHKIFVWLKGLHFVLVISSLHFLLQEAFTWTQ